MARKTNPYRVRYGTADGDLTFGHITDDNQISSVMIRNFKEPLHVNKFGIPEPKNSKKEIIPDLVMVPLVAFDKHLNRIGYGKGYYDKSLKKISKIKKKNN